MKEEHGTLITNSIDFIKRVEKSISNAVGDDIKMDIKINQLDTGNGNPYRIWDFINRNIGKNFPEERYILKSTKRGSWDIKPIFEKGTGMLYTLMREERFAELRKEVTKRNSAHYLQALAEVLNKNLQVQNEQICLFQEQNYYYDEKTKKLYKKYLRI